MDVVRFALLGLGIVGEAGNALVGYLAAVSRKLPAPLCSCVLCFRSIQKIARKPSIAYSPQCRLFDRAARLNAVAAASRQLVELKAMTIIQ